MVPEPDMAARHIDRAGNGLAYGLWAGFLGAGALGTIYLITAGMALVVLGVGLLVLPTLIDWLDRLAGIFADKASYAVGHRLLPPPTSNHRDSGPLRNFAALATAPQTYRTVAWSVVMGVTGIVIGSLVLLIVFAFARELTVPLWWWAVPPGEANTALGLSIRSWPQAISAMATAPVYLALALWVLPALAVGQARLCAAVLGCSTPSPSAVEPTVPHLEPRVHDRRVDRLTAREAEVLGLMAQGMDNSSIAEALVVSQAAILKHIRSIFIKLDLPPRESGHRRVQAVLAYLSQPRHGSAGTTVQQR